MTARTAPQLPAQAAAPSTAHSTLAGLALDSIHGCQAAQRLMHRLHQGIAPEDEVLQAMKAVFATGNAATCEGFARELQKRLEQRLERSA